ncbi:MAG: hypothetical protein WC378_00930 [Opitutaceae bacterium]|jgi:hypothetical protein
MSAPSIIALFKFEAQIASAARAVLASAGPFKVAISGDNTALSDTQTVARFARGPGITRTTIPAGPWKGKEEYTIFNGTLVVSQQIPFSDNIPQGSDALGNLFDAIIGKTSVTFTESASPFTAANLPWLRVISIEPRGLSYGTNGYRISADLTFQLIFEICKNAWSDEMTL